MKTIIHLLFLLTLIGPYNAISMVDKAHTTNANSNTCVGTLTAPGSTEERQDEIVLGRVDNSSRI